MISAPRESCFTMEKRCLLPNFKRSKLILWMDKSDKALSKASYGKSLNLQLVNLNINCFCFSLVFQPPPNLKFDPLVVRTSLDPQPFPTRGIYQGAFTWALLKALKADSFTADYRTLMIQLKGNLEEGRYRQGPDPFEVPHCFFDDSIDTGFMCTIHARSEVSW